MHSRIYSLRTLDGKPRLSFDLGNKIVCETPSKVEIQLPTGIVTLQKQLYLNTFKIFDDGNVFFYLCNKQPAQDYIFKRLLEHSISKIDNRVEKLNNLKADYSKILAA